MDSPSCWKWLLDAACFSRADDGWKDYDGDQTEKAMAKLTKVQSAMVRINLDDAHAKLIALGILLDSDDEPNFSDPF